MGLKMNQKQIEDLSKMFQSLSKPENAHVLDEFQAMMSESMKAIKAKKKKTVKKSSKAK